MHYFDYNATTPLCNAALKAYQEALEQDWRNPSSPYPQAARIRAKLEQHREWLAERIGRESPEYLVYTSGATEANQAVFSYLSRIHPDGKVLYSAVEHPSVSRAARHYFGENAVPIPVDSKGLVEPQTVAAMLTEHKPVCVSVIAAGNESGIIQPWQKLAELCRSQGIAFHTDATQAFGKLPSDKALGMCDFVVGCGHKFGGPKGVGWLGISSRHTGLSILQGGSQENNHRAGTENYPAIAAMHVALREAESVAQENSQKLELARNQFEETLAKTIKGIKFVGKETPRLWNTSMMIMPNFENTRWVSRLAKAGYEVSTGSACATGKSEPSSVLTAMGYEAEETKRAIRISGDAFNTTAGNWANLADTIIEIWNELNADANTNTNYGTVIDLD